MVNLVAAAVLILASSLLKVALAALTLLVIAVLNFGPWRPRPAPDPAPQVLPQPRGKTVGEYVSQLGGPAGTGLRSRPISDL
jgi:hypothetical protein